MALAFKRAFSGVLGTSLTPLYTADGVDFQTDQVTLTNNSGTDATVSIWTPSGGGPSDGDLVLKNKSITAGSTVTAFELRGHVLQNGMQLFALPSVAGVVTLAVSGRTKTV